MSSSTDISHTPSVEHDSPRLPLSSSPPATTSPPSSSYPPRSSSFQTNSQPAHPAHHHSNGTGTPAYSPSVHAQSLGPQSPSNGMAAGSNLRTGTPPSSLSPSPRQSEDIPFGLPLAQQQHHHQPHGPYQPSRRNSMPRSVASGDPVPTHYTPTVELEEPTAQTGFDEGILRALCDLDVSLLNYL